MRVSIDIVIPTVRLDPGYLRGLLDLPVPANVDARFYVVVDRPRAPIPCAVRDLVERDGVTVLANDGNLGAGEARNRGFAAGTGDFVLFLDDDVVPEPTLLSSYATAVASDAAESPGYVGVTRFPAPVNRFTHGVRVSDMLTFFDIAAERAHVEWGVTANLCVRRAYIVGTPFLPGFPKSGGGEDIDFCLRLRQAAGRPFRTVPSAVVRHPWWNGGARSYLRFFRWAYGDSRLPSLHPRYRYRDLPTLPEVWLCGLLVSPLLVWWGHLPALSLFFAGAALADVVVDFLELSSRRRISLWVSVEASIIRLVNDLGRLTSHVRHLHVRGLLERFDYFGTGESIAYERRVSTVKALSWAVLLWILVV